MTIYMFKLTQNIDNLYIWTNSQLAIFKFKQNQNTNNL